MVGHRGLVVYQRALEAAVRLDRIARRVGEFRPDLQKQLFRSSASIPLNIAEGANEWKDAEKARFYRIARRSCAECHATLDLAVAIGGNLADVSESRAELSQVTAMLGALIASKTPELHPPLRSLRSRGALPLLPRQDSPGVLKKS